jgi:hypothetical protein
MVLLDVSVCISVCSSFGLTPRRVCDLGTYLGDSPLACDVDSHSALKLGKLLFPLFALALDLPETFFDDKVSEFVLIFYP